MSLTKKRWIILAASCLINLCIGSLYAWSVFATPMAAYLSSVTGSEIAGLAIIFTIANAVGPITMISGGFINDKIGPKWVIFIGGILFGLGMIASGFAKSVGTLLLTYGLGVGLGVGLVYGCTVSNSVKFFPDKRGLVGGIATASYGISSVIIPIAANALIDNFDVTMAFKILGAAMLVIICVSAFFIQTCPKDFKPEGWNPPAPKAGAKVPVDKDWKAMLKDPIFYVMILMLCCGAFSGLMVTSQASPVAQNMIGMTAAEAAVAVSVLAMFNTLGRILAGFISDKIGSVNTILGVFLVSVLGLGLLFISGEGSVATFYIGVCIVGLCFGSIMGIYPGFTASQFGARNNSVNYGIMFIGFAAAGYFGPTIMSSIYASAGAYQTAFLAAMALAIAGAVLTFAFRKLSKKA
ncbi:MAG: OFA family MFS transporter [Oscillospiraceae bacterium]|nr:OFA family MFS transporter [Oscillospiraceae bacterium]MBQ6700301.1 OFA family MFS transporter [Oscillospiraceae bacterium]